MDIILNAISAWFNNLGATVILPIIIFIQMRSQQGAFRS